MTFKSSRPASESCDFCKAAISQSHQHVINVETRVVECVCDPCAVLFPNHTNAKHKRIPRTVHALPEFRMTEEQWEKLVIPIGIVFLYHSSRQRHVVGLYPSPAGAVESQLELGVWNEIERENPGLESLEPDVEGILIDRMRKPHEYLRIPIDECFRLVGMVRVEWRGFTGGSAVRKRISSFVDSLKERSR
jgi:hypothetical protein